MDEGDSGSESLQSSNWDVYKDAFAPPQPGRRVKPWERAPVPAHAPRLQGQKVWKKVQIKAQSQQDDKENHDAAQVELEKAGMGARKRPRMIGLKENIGDAPWKKGILGEEELLNRIPSPIKQRLSMAPGDADAFLVPRKRTNANHLITPRKPGRTTPLFDQAYPGATTQCQGLVFTPLNDQGAAYHSNKSPRKPSQQNMPLDDLNQEEPGIAASLEKPVRRRKSLRRSTRTLTRGTTPEQPPAAPANEILNDHASLSVASITETATKIAFNSPESAGFVFEDLRKDLEPPRPVSDSIEALDIAATTDVSEQGAVEAMLQERVSLKTTEEPLHNSQHEAELLIEGQFVPIFSAGEVLEGPTKQQHEALPVQTSSEASEEISNVQLESAVAIGEQFTAEANLTPVCRPSVPDSIELGTETRFASPTKSAGTPRSRRKTPQRRGSRRSTRLTRASSVPPEDISAQQATTHESLKAELTNPTSSPIKPRKIKMSTTEARESTVHVTVAEVHSAIEGGRCQHTEHVDPIMKPSVEIETQEQELESVEMKAVINIQSSNSTSSTEHVDVLEPALEDILSIAEIGSKGHYHPTTRGESFSLAGIEVEAHSIAVTATLDKMFAESGNLNIQEDVTLEFGAATAINLTEDQPMYSPSKPAQAEEVTKHVVDLGLEEPKEPSVEVLETLERISMSISTEELLEDSVEESTDDLAETSTPNASTTELMESISDNAPADAFDHDDTDMLRNFLTRVKANKAAKAGTTIPKRKRSLPHSPIRLPLGSEESVLCPSSPKTKDEFDVGLPTEISTKRKRDDGNLGDDDVTEPKSIRRSGRTRLPVKAAPIAAPSFIPVRRLGQEGDNTVTLRRNEEKELAALTRVNTRKNKGVALPPIQVLAKQAEEKEDPASRQRALKEVFDEKALKHKKAKKRKVVVWAEELVQFQTEEGKGVVLEEEKEKAAPIEEKKSAVKVGVRSKMTLGMVVNGTPAPKRKMRGRL